MQVAKRRLIVVSAIAIGGALAGLMLGNFVAGAPKITGMDELAAYNAMFDSMEETPATEVVSRRSFSERDGPTSYHCEGCDARRYDDRIEAAAAGLAQDFANAQDGFKQRNLTQAQKVLPKLPAGVALGDVLRAGIQPR